MVSAVEADSFFPRGKLAGIDASGYERNYASHYHAMRTQLKPSSIKTTLLVDLGRQVVLDILMTTTRKHGTRIVPSLIRRNRNSFQTLTADKGYDDQELRAMLQRKKVRPLIQHRVFKPHDRSSNSRMDQRLYRRRRNLVSVNEVGRKCGGWVRGRVWGRQFEKL